MRVLLRRDPGLRAQIKRPTRRLGSRYGGWHVCPDGLGPTSVVYSLGIGLDASFDLSAIEAYRAQVFAFDPTPQSIRWVEGQAWPPEFHFQPYGIAEYTGVAAFYPPENPEHVSHSLLERRATAASAIEVEVRRLPDVANQLGHRVIDVLKMDIEGAEYGVLEDVTGAAGLAIRQILVEFHHFLPGISVGRTRLTIARLNASGYRIFHVSESGHEVSLILT
jgi:FkbM family methyltransferase